MKNTEVKWSGKVPTVSDFIAIFRGPSGTRKFAAEQRARLAQGWPRKSRRQRLSGQHRQFLSHSLGGLPRTWNLILNWPTFFREASPVGSAIFAAIVAVGAGLLAHSSPARAAAVVPEGLVEAGRSPVAVAMRQPALKVYAISPASGLAGSEVTITGFGFVADNAIHFGDRVILHVAIKSAIGIACTPNPNCRGGIQQTLAFPIPDVPPGPYGVWVENSNGKSNAVTFTVTRS
jgi:hypothetical protein